MNAAASKANDQGVKFFNNQQYKLAATEFEKASSLKPYDGVSLSYKVASQSEDLIDKAKREQMVADIEKAEKLAPYSLPVSQNALTTYSNLGVYEVAMDYARRAIELQPMNMENYVAYFTSGYAVVSFYYNGANPKIAKEIADEVLTIESYVEELNAKRSEKIEFDRQLKEMLMYFEVVSYNVR